MVTNYFFTASRFALLETKAVIFHVIAKFEIIPVKKTVVPLVLSASNLNVYPKNGFWVGLKPRNVKS